MSNIGPKENERDVRTCVIVPALNEEATIYYVVKRALLTNLGLKVIVVDDGSTDRTSEKAKVAGAYVIRLPVSKGQWRALKIGFKKALKDGFDVVISMDGDGQHDPLDIPSLVRPILEGQADLVIGSRFYNGRVANLDMPPHRYLGVKFFSLLVSFLTGLKITDATSGFRAYRADLLQHLIRELKEDQYGVLEATLLAWRCGARICERPVKFRINKTSKKGSLRYFLNLCRVLVRVLLTKVNWLVSLKKFSRFKRG